MSLDRRCLTVAALWLTPALRAAEPPVVILKLDDVKQVKNAPVHRNWQRVADYLEANHLKGSFGIICSSLETGNPAYYQWIKDLHAKGFVEFWLHGYRDRTKDDPAGEFEQGSFEEQRDVLARCERLAQERLGFTFAAFGPHWSGTTEATDQALAAIPEIRVWLYGPKQPKHFTRLSIPRVMALENPTFVPDFEKFKAAYERYGSKEQVLVLQGHPPAWWTDERWNGFVTIVEFLKAQGCTFMTPSEYAAQVQAAP